MNGYVYYFTVIIFVMINYHLCSGDTIAEKIIGVYNGVDLLENYIIEKKKSLKQVGNTH